MKLLFGKMKTMVVACVFLFLLAGCKKQATESNRRDQSTGSASVSTPSIGIQEAAVQGNVDVIRQYIGVGADLNQKDAVSGSTPLITAATFGRTEVAKVLVEAGADVNSRNNDGSTPLITAAFLCRTEIVQLLLENGADKEAKNNVGSTALDSVSAPFDEVKGIYDLLGAVLGPLGLQLDYERIKSTRPRIATMLR